MTRVVPAMTVPGPVWARALSRANAVLRLRRGPARMVIMIIVATALLRVVLSAMLGLGIDESYMVSAGRVPQLSYYDHPPLAWWLAWGASHLLGSEAPLVVRMPFIALFAGSTWLMYRLTAILFSRQAGLWAVMAFNLSPVFGLTSASWVLPDGPLIASLLGFLICLARATGPDRRGDWAWWLGAGLCAGLALLSKYNAVLVIAGAAVALLSHPIQRRWLLRAQPWAAVLTAATMFMPVVAWNAEHHWCSIAFQGGRALGRSWHPLAPFIVLSGEALYVLPWLWLPMMAALVRAWRRGRHEWSSWLLACCASPAIVLFALVGLWSRKPVLFHWAAPGYLVLFPLLGAALVRWSAVHGRRAPVLVGMASTALIIAGAGFIGSEARWNWLPMIGEDFAQGADPDLAAVDWTSLEPEMRARGWIGAGAPALATLHWHSAGKLAYALGRVAPVFCLGADPREFGLTNPAARHLGEDVLVLSPGPRQARVKEELAAMFDAVEPRDSLILLHHGRPAMEIAVYLGRRLADPARLHDQHSERATGHQARRGQSVVQADTPGVR